MKKTLWTKNFTLVTAASALGAVGGIAGGFALSFLVFDETGSTLASALILAIQLVPFFVLPLFLAPVMDRLPRKPFLVAGDLIDGVLYALMGLYLLKFEFSYAAYLGYSLLLACLESFDELAFQSIYPKLIPEGMEQKGYAVSTTLYPILRVLMLPLAGILLDAVGAAWILIGQGGLSLLASANPDGLEWSLFGNEEAGYSANMGLDEEQYGAQSAAAEKAAAVQEKTSLLPDYNFAGSDSAAGTSVSGLVGCALVAALAACISLAGRAARKKSGKKQASAG